MRRPENSSGARSLPALPVAIRSLPPSRWLRAISSSRRWVRRWWLFHSPPGKKYGAAPSPRRAPHSPRPAASRSCKAPTIPSTRSTRRPDENDGRCRSRAVTVPCTSIPVVRDAVVYTTASVVVTRADANRAATYLRSLFALDAATGKERWRYESSLAGGIRLEQPIATADTIFGMSGASLYTIASATGRERWKPVEVRGPVDGRDRALAVFGLVDAGAELIGLTRGAMMAFDKNSGLTAWQIPGQYGESAPSTAVSGRVLYFRVIPARSPQGRHCPAPSSTSAASPCSKSRCCLPENSMHSISIRARCCRRVRVLPLRRTGRWLVTPVDGGLWVDSYQALVKLQ